jgi:hypothetical protein
MPAVRRRYRHDPMCSQIDVHEHQLAGGHFLPTGLLRHPVEHV